MSSTWVTMLPCLRSNNSLLYSEKDTATARCRLSKQIFKQHKANIGWIFHFEVTVPHPNDETENDISTFEVLCTGWPQLNNNCNENVEDEEECVFLDDSVVKGSHFLWCEGRCRILRAHPPNPCHSVRCLLPKLNSQGKRRDLLNSVFGGFPVAAGFRLTASPCVDIKSAARGFTVQSLPTGQYGVIDVMTLLMAVSIGSKENGSSSSRSSSSGSSSSGSSSSSRSSSSGSSSSGAGAGAVGPRASCTGVVHTLIRNCIFPSVLFPVTASAKQTPLFTSGVLLSGPPGVGKTYAITAVKEICKNICDITIHNLCIPDILADTEPITHVEKILNSAQSVMTPSPTPQKSLPFHASSSGNKGTPTRNQTPQKQHPNQNYHNRTQPSTPSSTSAPRTPDAGSASSSLSPSPQPTGRFSWLTPSPHKPGAPTSSSSVNSTPGSHHPKSTPFSPSSSSSSSSSSSAAVPEVHVVMLDEVDALGGAGEGGVNATNDLQHTIKHLLCTWMDAQAARQLHHQPVSQSQSQSQLQPPLSPCQKHYAPIIVIATSNRPSDVDPCFCRGGRLEKEIDISESSVLDREQILQGLLTSALPVMLGMESEMEIDMDTLLLGDSSSSTTVHEALEEGEKERSFLKKEEEEEEEEGGIAGVIPVLAKEIALSTGGYVAADLSSLVSELVSVHAQTSRTQAHTKTQTQPQAQNQILNQTRSTSSNQATATPPSNKSFASLKTSHEHVKHLVMSAVQIAKKTVAPSCLRGATVELPNLTYDDVIGYEEVKKNLSRVLSFSSVASRKKLIQFGQNTMLGGVLLHGPPGNSKTRLVQAAASMHGLPMISLSSADVYSAYVGDSEAEIRRVFTLARQSHPCVLFMDEIDALVTNRQEENSSNNVESRVLSTLLNEMDGIDGGGNGVFVIAATNRIDFIDSALLRKGRFHHLLHVPLPNIDEKNKLLKYFAKRFDIDAASVDAMIPKLSNVLISGADVENLCREAGMAKIRNYISLSKK